MNVISQRFLTQVFKENIPNTKHLFITILNTAIFHTRCYILYNNHIKYILHNDPFLKKHYTKKNYIDFVAKRAEHETIIRTYMSVQLKYLFNDYDEIKDLDGHQILDTLSKELKDWFSILSNCK